MMTVAQVLTETLRGSISEITLRGVTGRLGALGGKDPASLTHGERDSVHGNARLAIRLFAQGDKSALEAAVARVLGAGSPRQAPVQVPRVLTTARSIAILSESDIAQARGEAWAEAVRIGFSRFASVKVATAVSELARNIVFYAIRGTVAMRSRQEGSVAVLEVVASDQGPGISAEKLQQVFAGQYRSERGMGQGLVAVKRLAETFDLRTAPGQGTTVSCSFRSGS